MSFSNPPDRPLDHSKYDKLNPFLESVWLGDSAMVRYHMESRYNPRNHEAIQHVIDPRTGMNALHIAVGRGNLELARMLVEAGVKAIPDKEGRMPSLIAAELGVSDELADFIFDVESRDLKVEALQDV